MKRPPSPATALTLSLLVTLLAPLLPSAASAQTHEEQARHHFDEGARHFYEGDFSRAILEFRRAYHYQPDPMILYNISLAHSRLGNISDAYEAGQAAASMPGMPEAARVRNDARVGALAVALSAESMASRISRLATPTSNATRTPLDEPNHGYAPGPIGWTAVALGGAGAGLLTYALVLDRSLENDIEAYRSASDEGQVSDYDALRDRIATRTTRGRIALYSGLGLTIAGAGLLAYDLLDTNGAPNYKVSVGLHPLFDGAGLTLTARFR
jgi:tetratricopeptide (TPR) repeat protein